MSFLISVEFRVWPEEGRGLAYSRNNKKPFTPLKDLRLCVLNVKVQFSSQNSIMSPMKLQKCLKPGEIDMNLTLILIKEEDK